MNKFLISAFSILSLNITNAQIVLNALDAPDVIKTIEIPGTIQIFNGKHTLYSVDDQDYFPFSTPTGVASWENRAANGMNEAHRFQIIGEITTTGFSVKIPVNNNSGRQLTIPAATHTVNVPADKTHDGVSRTLELSWAQTNINTGDQVLTATIKSLDGTLKIKGLDVNAGYGADLAGVELATFNFLYRTPTLQSEANFKVFVTPLVPDKLWGHTGNIHDFAYSIVKGPDNKIWLNNNLGASYSKRNHAQFNPLQQATEMRDRNAYGSLFQWQRPPDEHELINWDNTTPVMSSAINKLHTSWFTQQGDTSFYFNSAGPLDTNRGKWTSAPADSNNNAHWKKDGFNNPCPYGFQVPTKAQFEAVGNNLYNHPILKLPAAGQRLAYNGNYDGNSYPMSYWTSDSLWQLISVKSETTTKMENQSYSFSGASFHLNGLGASVRCILAD